jgi:ribosome-interacting GTPase 1
MEADILQKLYDKLTEITVKLDKLESRLDIGQDRMGKIESDIRFQNSTCQSIGCQNRKVQNAIVYISDDETLDDIKDIVHIHRDKKATKNKIKMETVSKIVGFAVTGFTTMISIGVLYYLQKVIAEVKP